MITEENKIKIIEENKKLIESKGYRYNSDLPVIQSPRLRDIEDIKGRMSVMNALINISFGAPIYIIREWIDKHGLTKHLSDWEKQVLAKNEDQLLVVESNTVRWYLEGVWALMWATNVIDSLDETQWSTEDMIELLPNLQKNEDNSKVENIKTTRSEEELYTMIDYYYRVHWYCADERENNRESKIDEGLVYERRKALDWMTTEEQK